MTVCKGESGESWRELQNDPQVVAQTMVAKRKGRDQNFTTPSPRRMISLKPGIGIYEVDKHHRLRCTCLSITSVFIIYYSCLQAVSSEIDKHHLCHLLSLVTPSMVGIQLDNYHPKYVTDITIGSAYNVQDGEDAMSFSFETRTFSLLNGSYRVSHLWREPWHRYAKLSV